MELLSILFIVFLLAGIATVTKYFGGEGMIAGYNTASPAEQQYMKEKGIGAFIGNYLYLAAAIILAGYLSKKAGFVWGQELSWILFTAVIIIMLIRAQSFNPPATMSTARSARTQKFALWSVVIITLGVVGMITWSALPAHFDLGTTQVKISGSYGFSFNYGNVEDISLKPELPAVGMKTNGLNLGPILKGHFRVKGMDGARLFVRSAKGPVLIVTFKDHSDPLLINFSDPRETNRLYQQLKSHTEHD